MEWDGIPVCRSSRLAAACGASPSTQLATPANAGGTSPHAHLEVAPEAELSPPPSVARTSDARPSLQELIVEMHALGNNYMDSQEHIEDGRPSSCEDFSDGFEE
jgi:hypothetical protein